MQTQYQVPKDAEIVLRNGQIVNVSGKSAEFLYFSLVNSSEVAGDDEGGSVVGKALQNLGGRNEFEKFRQKQIIDELTLHETPGQKRALLIGDSIRMRIADSTGYGVHAYSLLSKDFNITHIPHNCGGTKVVKKFLDNWLSCQPDIVHINTGLHDLAFGLKEGYIPPAYNTVTDYCKNLEEIITKILESSAQKVLWSLNTPVQEVWHTTVPRSGRPRKIGRRNSDIRQYNEASLEIMRKYDVPVIDLYTPLWKSGVESVLLADGVHLNHRGSLIVAQKVSEAIQAYV